MGLPFLCIYHIITGMLTTIKIIIYIGLIQMSIHAPLTILEPFQIQPLSDASIKLNCAYSHNSSTNCSKNSIAI